MTMKRIFLDFELQLEARRAQEVAFEAKEVMQSESSKLMQIDRLAAQLDRSVLIEVAGGMRWEGVMESFGSGWVQLHTHSENILVPVSAVTWWEGGNRFASQDTGEVRRKLTFNFALRALSTSRIPARVFHIDGGSTSEGTLERVGMDFVEMSMHGLESNYRSKKISGYRTIAISRIAAVATTAV